MKLHRRTEIMERSRNVQDLPAMLFELCKTRTTNVERTLQIDIDDSSKTVWRQLLRGTQKVSRGTVHDDVDLTKLLDSLCNGFFNFLRLSNINGHGNRLSAVLVDRLCSRYQVVHLPANERHGRPRFRKCARHSTSDSRPTSGNERHTSFQNSFIEDCLTHCSRALIASSNLNFPSYKALPTITLSTRASPASRRRLMSSRLETPPDAVTRTFAASATASVC